MRIYIYVYVIWKKGWRQWAFQEETVNRNSSPLTQKSTSSKSSVSRPNVHLASAFYCGNIRKTSLFQLKETCKEMLVRFMEILGALKFTMILKNSPYFSITHSESEHLFTNFNHPTREWAKWVIKPMNGASEAERNAAERVSGVSGASDWVAYLNAIFLCRNRNVLHVLRFLNYWIV